MSVSLYDLTPATVSLNDTPLRGLDAYLPETRWNGWQCPYFSVDEVRRHRAQFDELAATNAELLADEGLGERYEWREDLDLPSIVTLFDDGTEQQEVGTVVTTEGITLITIGWGFFTWARSTAMTDLTLKTIRSATTEEVDDLIYGTGALTMPWWVRVDEVTGGYRFRYDDPELGEGNGKGDKIVTHQQILDAAGEFLQEGRGGEDAREAMGDSIGYLDALGADSVLQRAVMGREIYG